MFPMWRPRSGSLSGPLGWVHPARLVPVPIGTYQRATPVTKPVVCTYANIEKMDKSKVHEEKRCLSR